MVDLTKVVDENTWIISDTHFSHWRVLIFEPIRLEYLSDYNTDIIVEAQQLLQLIKTIPPEEQRDNTEIASLAKFLLPHHDTMLKEKWNSVVQPNDTVLHLGDFAFRDVEGNSIGLNGNKILLRGNHDLKSASTYRKAGWKDVIESVKVVVGKNTFEKRPVDDRYWNGLIKGINIDNESIGILFSHYPIYNDNEWDMKKYGNITDMLENIFEDFGCEINIHGHTHSSNAKSNICINTSLEKCRSLMPVKLGEIIRKRLLEWEE